MYRQARGQAMSRTRKPERSGGDSTALPQVIFAGLCDEIVSGKLRPGETLSRRRIAERYGASYTPVIEALVRLEYTGLIETEAAQMARVRRVTLESIEDDYVFREAIECQAIRLACDTATEAEVDELDRLAEALDVRAEGVRADSAVEGPRLHWDFHRRIAEISRHRVLVRELERIAMVTRFHALWIAPPAVQDPPQAHSRLVDAIKGRDPLAADAEVRTHVRRGLENERHAYRLGVCLRP
jgi:DNA-binding GntR family transcriptional regulator